MAEKNDGINKVILSVMAIAVTLLLAAFGSLETRKVDKSAFDVHLTNESAQFERIDGQLDKIDGKIDKLLMQKNNE